MRISPAFDGMFSTGRPATGSVDMDGQSDANPIYLPEVTVNDFDNLLSWIYPA